MGRDAPAVDAGRVRVVVNPASGGGRGARRLGAIRSAFAAQGMADLVLTARAGDEERLVFEALDDGIDTLVVAGGDGTWSKAASTLARAGSPARMAFLSAGTGNDFAKNLRAPSRDAGAMARLLASGTAVERRVDMGRVDDAWFLNVAGFGFDVAVLRASTANGRSLLRGPARYVAAAIGELFSFEAAESRFDPSRDGLGFATAPWRRRLLLVFSNGAHFGGAFHIAPGATVDDGALDAIAVADHDAWVAWRRARLFARALRGTHLADAAVEHARGARFTLGFAEPAWLEVDGELRRARAATCEVMSMPGVLRVLDAAH